MNGPWMPTVTIDEQGRLVLPKALRERLGLAPGRAHRLHLWETGDGVLLEPEPTPASIDDGGDGMPAITIQSRPTISNDDVVAAIRRDRSTR